MRSDMQKVITERERYGSSAPNWKVGRKIRPVDASEDDDQPKQMSRARLYGGRRKRFSDVLNPLRRYLRKNVGRPWNKVHSEIREHLDDRSIMGRHLFEHLSQEVELHPFVEDGVVYGKRRYGCRGPVTGFYVHPRTGLLCWLPYRNHRKERLAEEARQETTRVPIDATTSYVKVAGIWYRAEYKQVDPPAQWSPGATSDWVWYHDGSHWLNMTSKRQCAEKELRANGLVNSPVSL